LAKRLFDILFSFCGLLLLSPIMLCIAFLIKSRMPGPVFFRQERVGQHGRIFRVLKFRTMELNNSGNTITVKGDQRITPLGKVLRKYKLDELPELFNVLKGEMSFVGPRPDIPKYSKLLKGENLLILNLRPGITGPATLKYAKEEELLAEVPDPERYNDEVIFPDKVRLNLEYYYKHTIFKDISLIYKTVFRRYVN
jgi:lipopolysaccharide/colanic/teichoic acid biosynthesis glycosyltransferase